MVNSSRVDDNDIYEQAKKSGLSYNEAKEWIAQKTGGRNTKIYSDTDIEAVRQKLNESVKG